MTQGGGVSLEIQYLIGGALTTLALAALGLALALMWRGRAATRGSEHAPEFVLQRTVRILTPQNDVEAAVAAEQTVPVSDSSAVDLSKQQTPPDDVPTLISVPNLGAREAQPLERFDLRHEAVVREARAGKPSDEIARSTGMPMNQVELVLRLLRQSDSATAARLGRNR